MAGRFVYNCIHSGFDADTMNYSEFRFHVEQRYVRDVWIEYRLADQSCVINAELKSGEVKPLMLSNEDCVHRYKSCDTASRPS